MSCHRQLPTYFFNIGADRNNRQKIDCELRSFCALQPLKNFIFQIRQPHRQAKFSFISFVIVVIQRTTNCATVITLMVKSGALNNLIKLMMLSQTCKIFSFDCRIVMECLHCVLLSNKKNYVPGTKPTFANASANLAAVSSSSF